MVKTEALLNQMDKLEDLLPGIEEFLSNVLAKESLSQHAEEQRLYFLERLDIIKLPPSIPPRPQSLGIRLYPLHSSPPPPAHNSIPSADQDDFAAYQRELSRALVDSETSPEPTEVKVYDDIDLSDISFVHEHSTIQTEEESVYEIPQAKTRNLSDSGYEKAKTRTLSDSGYEKAVDVSQPLRAVSLETLDVLHSPSLPPPLPPRRDRATSDAASRSSIGSILEEKMAEFSQRLGNESHTSGERTHDSRSERSSDDILDEDDLDGLSYDSMEDTSSLTQLSEVQLPKPTKKRRKSQRRKMVQSLTTMKEVAVPLKNLEDVLLTGELHYRSKLTWTKKIVALTIGRLICYKPEKVESRPSFVILLTGYNATFQKREGKRNFEINLVHDNFESHVFLADFKEWAETWCEYMKYSAQGKKPSGPVLNLTRGTSTLFDNQDGTYQLGKSPVGSSGSNLSLASSDGFDTDPGTVKVKKRDSTGTKTARMGSFAFRATQFFESLGKKSSIKKTSSSGSDKARPLSATLSQSSLTEETVSPLTPESDNMLESPLEVQRHIKHQGFLDIYSSFNKRKWGKRWCMVHENNFECYRTQTSEVCELEFILQDCVLRRAIEETKSELGLMLLENNREKITIEPLNWTELGSWLRVLMRETSTIEIPEGLAGYMDDSNPYHEAIEVTRLSMLSDPFPKTPTESQGVVLFPSATSNSNGDVARSGNLRNRDSGNCSSESMDGRFGSLERPKGNKTHSSYTDSSLPRVKVPDSGDIYTQIRKQSVTGSSGKCSSSEQSQQRYKSEPANTLPSGSQMFHFNFDSDEVNFAKENETEASLVDEILSQFRSQISTSYDNDEEESEKMDTETECTSVTYCKGSPDNDSVKDIPNDVNMTSDPSNISSNIIMCPHNIPDSIVADSVTVLKGEHAVYKENLEGVFNDDEVEIRRKLVPDNIVRKTSSLLYGEKGMTEVIDELRNRLVQLKKDRISIRDRKQKVTSDVDREYLEAEFNRLNRECEKVSEEIKYLEKLQKLETIVANKEKFINATGASNDQFNESNSNEIEQKSRGFKMPKEKTNISVKNSEVTDKENHESDIVVEIMPDICDSGVVPKVNKTQTMFETVQETIVSGDELVHKPFVVDANVIIVEPDFNSIDGHAELHSERNRNGTKHEEDTKRKQSKTSEDGFSMKSYKPENGDTIEETGKSGILENFKTTGAEKVKLDNIHVANIQTDINNELGKFEVSEEGAEECVQAIETIVSQSSDNSEASFDSDNGVMKQLAVEFEQKLILKSDSDS